MFGQRSKVGVCPINSHVLCRAGQVGFRTLVAGCIDVGVGRKKTLHHVRVALLRREMKRPRETSTVAAGGVAKMSGCMALQATKQTSLELQDFSVQLGGHYALQDF